MRCAAKLVGRRLHHWGKLPATSHSSRITGLLIATFTISEFGLTHSKHRPSRFSNRNKKGISVISLFRQARVAGPVKSCRMREELSRRVR